MASLDDALRDFRLEAYYRNPQRDRSSFTSGNEKSALWFFQLDPAGRVFLIQSQAPYVIRQIQRAFGVSPVDGRFGPQTLAAVHAHANRAGITFPNRLTRQTMEYALRHTIHGGRGEVRLPAQFELPDPDRPTLASGSSTFLGARDVQTGEAVAMDPSTGIPQAPPGASPSPPPAPVVNPAAPPAPAPAPAPAPGGVNLNVNAGAQGNLMGPLAAMCPPCHTRGPDGSCKPMDPNSPECRAQLAQANLATAQATGTDGPGLGTMMVVGGVMAALGVAAGVAASKRKGAPSKAVE